MLWHGRLASIGDDKNKGRINWDSLRCSTKKKKEKKKGANGCKLVEVEHKIKHKENEHIEVVSRSGVPKICRV